MNMDSERRDDGVLPYDDYLMTFQKQGAVDNEKEVNFNDYASKYRVPGRVGIDESERTYSKQSSPNFHVNMSPDIQKSENLM